jgi:hypothetical protein
LTARSDCIDTASELGNSNTAVEGTISTMDLAVQTSPSPAEWCTGLSNSPSRVPPSGTKEEGGSAPSG